MTLRLANDVPIPGLAPHQLGGVCAGAEMTNVWVAVATVEKSPFSHGSAACLLPSFSNLQIFELSNHRPRP